MDDWPFTFAKAELESHSLKRRQNISKNDGRIEIECFEWLHRYFAGQFRRLDNFQDSVLFAQIPIGFHIAASLTHQPDWRGVHLLPLTGCEKTLHDVPPFTLQASAQHLLQSS